MLQKVLHTEEPVAGNLHGGFCEGYERVIDVSTRHSIPHELLMKAVRKHTESKWMLLYIKRWLTAPLQKADGPIEARKKGTPQGSVISPLLSNLFLHYCFDEWMHRNSYGCKFERYADDIIIHCQTAKQAIAVKLALRSRLSMCGLEMHREKTKLVYCKDSNRTERVDRSDFAVSFDFLGYTFKPRQARNKEGEDFTCFLPAVSRKSKVGMSEKMRSWKVLRCSQLTLQQIAEQINPVIQGWINYYGRFYRGELQNYLSQVNIRLKKWAGLKFKKLRRCKLYSLRWLKKVAKQQTTLFAHWKIGAVPMVR